MTAIAPLVNVSSPDPFKATGFLHVSGNLDAVEVSPEGDLLTAEVSPPRKHASTQDDMMIREPKPAETFYFLRVVGTGAADSPIQAVAAGVVKVHGVGTIPMNARGYLLARSERRSRWSMQFETFDGEIRKLANLDSSCAPRMQLISPSQYLVFTCRGSDDKVMLSAFDFSPHEMWEEPLNGVSPYAQFAYAQQAGRFAISRTVASLASGPNPSAGSGPMQEQGIAQEVKIYQMQSGDLLMKLICSPTARSGQNFDLAPDGLSVVVVRDGALELYRLPPMSAQDAQELAAVQHMEPQPAKSVRIELRKMLRDAAEESVEADAETAAEVRDNAAEVAAPALSPAASAEAPVAAEAVAPANAGDVGTTRKPPSLLNPGESADDGSKAPK